jgi:hypothetical protein
MIDGSSLRQLVVHLYSSNKHSRLRVRLAKTVAIRFCFLAFGLGPLVCGISHRLIQDTGEVKSQSPKTKDRFEIRRFQIHHFSGAFVGRVTPVPIPNTKVKPASTPAALLRW